MAHEKPALGARLTENLSRSHATGNCPLSRTTRLSETEAVAGDAGRVTSTNPSLYPAARLCHQVEVESLLSHILREPATTGQISCLFPAAISTVSPRPPCRCR